MRKSKMFGLQPPQFPHPHIGKRKSFEKAEAEARKLLQERGMSEDQIEVELNRTKREQLDD